MKKRRLLAPLLLPALSLSQSTILSSNLSQTSLYQHNTSQSSSDPRLPPSDVFLMVSPVLAVIIMALVLIGIILKRKSGEEEKAAAYEEFEDVENATENMELMQQNREGFT